MSDEETVAVGIQSRDGADHTSKDCDPDTEFLQKDKDSGLVYSVITCYCGGWYYNMEARQARPLTPRNPRMRLS